MKKRVVFASVLKPVDDTRTYLKMARSLVPGHKYEIFIIGYPSKQKVFDPDITFLPLKPFSRIGFGRIQAYRTIHEHIQRLQPDILIINTHELLQTAIQQKARSGCRIIYDVRENYYENLTRTRGLPKLLAASVRKKEANAAPLVDHFILAEQCYAHQLDFINNKYIILENKALEIISSTNNSSKEAARFIFTGTLSEQTGVFDAIRMVESLHADSPKAELLICGNSFQPGILQKLRKKARTRPWLKLDISDSPLPYDHIVQAIRQADAGIIMNRNDEHIREKMPTKLYEYIAAQLPIILREGSSWKSFCDRYSAAVIWKDDPDLLISDLESATFYSVNPGNEVFWTDEGDRLKVLVDNLLSN